jgi:hypothetical protein
MIEPGFLDQTLFDFRVQYQIPDSGEVHAVLSIDAFSLLLDMKVDITD